MLESYDLWRETGKSDRKLDCFVTCMLLEEGEVLQPKSPNLLMIKIVLLSECLT